MGYIAPSFEEWKNPELIRRRTQRIQRATSALWFVALVAALLIVFFVLVLAPEDPR